ncbi:hypothetical protein CR513_20994, partial [Mucuna pruriens]
MEFLKDSDFQLMYHPTKVSIVVDVLSRKVINMLAIMVRELELVEKIKELLGTKKVECYSLRANDILRYKGGVCIPQDPKLKNLVLEEGYKSRLSLHPSATKMYQGLKKMFYCYVGKYVIACLTCQKAKIKHQRLEGLLQFVKIPEVPLSIILDRDIRFTSHFKKSLHQVLGTKLKLISTYHLQTNRQSERMISLWKIYYELVCWII